MLGDTGALPRRTSRFALVSTRALQVKRIIRANYSNPPTHGGKVGQATIDYVHGFVPARTGANYHPHLTSGLCTRALAEKLKTEPFTPMPFRAETASLFQLGDFGVAQVRLHDFARL